MHVFPEINKTKISQQIENEISKCDVFIHAAEPASNESYTPEFMRLAMENCSVLANILGDRLIYVSSVLVYGLGSSIPHSENEAAKPFNNYTEHKSRIENHLEKFGSRTFRISNLVGVGMHESPAIRQISRKIANNEVVEIEPNNQRDYIWICDVCEVFEQLLIRRDKKIINIGSGLGTSTKDLIQILQGVGFPKNIKHEVHEKQHHEQSCLPNVSLLQSLVPHQRYTSLSRAIKPILSKEYL